MNRFSTFLRIRANILALGTLLFFLSVNYTLAADTATSPTFSPLVGVPGLTDSSGIKSLPEYLNAVYLLLITLGALFGVVKIAFAGVKYSLSEVVTDKGEAKKEIYGVLLGLGLLLIPFVVLNTINPELTRLDVLHGAKKIDMNVSSAPSTVRDNNSVNTATGRTITTCSATVSYPGRTCSGATCTDGDPSYDFSSCEKSCDSKNDGIYKKVSDTTSTCEYSKAPTGAEMTAP